MRLGWLLRPRLPFWRRRAVVRAVASPNPFVRRRARRALRRWQSRKQKRRSLKIERRFLDGEGGIRTHGSLTTTLVFETSPIDHSGTSPQNVAELYTTVHR